MDENIMTTNEEVVELTEEIVKSGFGKSLKMFGIGAATVVVGGVAYKYAVKPLITKWTDNRAAKKQAKEDLNEVEDSVVTKLEIVD